MADHVIAKIHRHEARKLKEAWIYAATRALVQHDLPDGVSLRYLGNHRLKDIAHTERLYDLVIDGLRASGWTELSAFRGAFALFGLCCALSYLWFLYRDDTPARSEPQFSS